MSDVRKLTNKFRLRQRTIMAWVPNSQFEDDLVDMEPDFNFVHGQLAYDMKKQGEFWPRPKCTYEYLKSREKRNSELENIHGSRGGTGRDIRQSLQLMENIQKIAGTRPLGEHATMKDWEDESTNELEALAMMRHFGMMSMATDSLPVLPEVKPPEGPIKIIRNGRKQFPLITDPEFLNHARFPERRIPVPVVRIILPIVQSVPSAFMNLPLQIWTAARSRARSRRQSRRNTSKYLTNSLRRVTTRKWNHQSNLETNSMNEGGTNGECNY